MAVPELLKGLRLPVTGAPMFINVEAIETGSKEFNELLESGDSKTARTVVRNHER